jgi:hypothetical protein
MTEEIHVRMTDGKLMCFPCGEEIALRRVAMLLRHRPGGPFDPVCLDCAGQIIASAALVMAPLEVVLLEAPE